MNGYPDLELLDMFFMYSDYLYWKLFQDETGAAPRLAGTFRPNILYTGAMEPKIFLTTPLNVSREKKNAPVLP